MQVANMSVTKIIQVRVYPVPNTEVCLPTRWLPAQKDGFQSQSYTCSTKPEPSGKVVKTDLTQKLLQ